MDIIPASVGLITCARYLSSRIILVPPIRPSNKKDRKPSFAVVRDGEINESCLSFGCINITFTVVDHPVCIRYQRTPISGCRELAGDRYCRVLVLSLPAYACGLVHARIPACIPARIPTRILVWLHIPLAEHASVLFPGCIPGGIPGRMPLILARIPACIPVANGSNPLCWRY